MRGLPKQREKHMTRGTLGLFAIHFAEAKFGLVLQAAARADGQGSAEVVFDERGFIARSFRVPGINAKGGEIAGLAFRAADSGDKILRLVAGRIGNAVEFEPGERPNIRRRDAFADRIGQVKLDKSSNDPAGYGNRLVTRLRRGSIHGARGGLGRRARSKTAHKKPVFLLGSFGLSGGFPLVGYLNPIGNGPADDFERNAPAELVQPRLGTAGLDTKVGGDFGAAARLHGHAANRVEELYAAQPQGRFHEIAVLDPPDGAGSRTNFAVVIPLAEDIHTFAIVQRAERLANLSDAAPHGDAALADERFAKRRVTRPQSPGHKRDQGEKGHSDEKTALHAGNRTEKWNGG